MKHQLSKMTVTLLSSIRSLKYWTPAHRSLVMCQCYVSMCRSGFCPTQNHYCSASGEYVCDQLMFTQHIAAGNFQLCSQNHRERERERVSLLQEQGCCPCHMRGSHGSACLSLVILVIACGVRQPQVPDCHSRGHHLHYTYALASLNQLRRVFSRIMNSQNG